ncbi:MAG: hypothetical protein ACOZAQ_00515 [Pseudomonadota bacterium]
MRLKSAGFSILVVLFILVVLSALGAVMMRVSTTQHLSSAQAKQGKQAYFAARAGVDYAVTRLDFANGCTRLDGAILVDGFSVVLQCTAQGTFDEGGLKRYTLYQVIATASTGTAGGLDHTQRALVSTVVTTEP